MATHKRQRQKTRNSKGTAPRLTLMEFRIITFISTMLVASIVITLGIKEPVVWTFLGTAIGISIGPNTSR